MDSQLTDLVSGQSLSSSESGFEIAREVSVQDSSAPSTSGHRPVSPRTAVSGLFSNLIRSSFPEINDLGPRIEQTLSTMDFTLETATKTAQAVTSLVSAITSILEQVPAYTAYVKRVADAIALLVDIVIAWWKKLWELIPTLLYRLLSIFGLTDSLIQLAVTRLLVCLRSKELNQNPDVLEVEAEPQGNSNPILNTFVWLTGVACMNKNPDDKQLRMVNERLKFATMWKSFNKDIVETLFSFVQCLPEVFKAWCAEIVPLQWWFSIFYPGSKYYKWIDNVHALKGCEIRERASYDIEIQDTIRSLYAEGEELVKLCATQGPDTSKVFTLLKDTFKIIDDLFSVVDFGSRQRAFRQTPFIVYLYGLSGQGKSFLSSIIPSILSGKPLDTPNLSWTRNPVQQHWDGYSGQYCIKYDDFSATRNSNVAPGEHAELMSICSNDQYRVPMADLDDKGEVFRSQVVVCSSNDAYPRPNTIACYEALWRRRNAMYEVSCRPEFYKPGSRNVDETRIPRDNSHWVFRKFARPWDPNCQAGRAMTYNEWIQDLKESHVSHIRNQQLALERSREMVERAITAEPQGLTTLYESYCVVTGTAASAVGGAWFCQELKTLYSERQEVDWLSLCKSLALLVAGLSGTLYYVYALWTKNRRTLQCEQVEQLKKIVASHSKTLGRSDQARALLVDFIGMIHSKTSLDYRQKLANELICGAIQSEKSYKLQKDFVAGDVDAALQHWRSAGFSEEMLNKMRELLLAEGAYHGVHAGGGKVMPQIVRSEGSSDANAFNIVEHSILPNLVVVNCSMQDLCGLMVAERVCMLPRHIFHDQYGNRVEAGVVVKVTTTGHCFQEYFDPSNLIQIGSDVVLYRFSSNARTWKDIRQHFILDSEIGGKAQYEAQMCAILNLTPTVQNMTIQRNTKPVKYTFDEMEPDPMYKKGNIILKHEGWEYRAHTRRGMCGAPLVIFDTSKPRKLCGIHIAGAPDISIGFGMLVTREMIDKGFQKFGVLIGGVPLRPTALDYDLTKAIVQPQGNFSFLGTLSRPIFSPVKSKIQPSLLHGKIFAPTKGPSVLSKFDPRLKVAIDPFKKGVEKYGAVAPCVHIPLLKEVSHHLKKLFSGLKPGPIPPKVVSEQIAINGLIGSEFLQAIPLDTSAGYPYNQRKRMSGKTSLIAGNDGEREIVDQELRDRVDIRLKAAKRGQRVPSLWIDTEKDELRDLKKIEEGSTRVFTIPPLDFTIVFRELTAAFCAMFYENQLNFFSAVGITPESVQWTQLYKKLCNNSSIGFAGDYSGWDGNISPIVMEEICDIINSWYGDEQEFQVARRVMFDELAHTTQVCVNLVYMTHIGNPSGNPLTAILNTIANAIYLRYCYLRVAPPEYRSLAHYENNVVDIIYGDDNIVSVKEEVRSFFNPDSVSREMREVNMTYTSTTKDGKSSFKELADETFLKRGFGKGERGMSLPLMSKVTIQELTNWTRKSDHNTNEQMTVDNCNESLRFAFFYGLDYFTSLYDKICSLLGNLSVYIHDYSYYYVWFYDLNNCENGQAGKPLNLWGTQRKVTLQPAKTVVHTTRGIGDANLKALQSPLDISFSSMALDATYEQTQTPPSSEFFLACKQSTASSISLDNAKGIIKLAQRKVDQDDGSLGQIAQNKVLSGHCISDPAWSLPDMSHRSVFLGKWDWTTTQTPGTILYSALCPFDMVVNYLQSAPFERYLYWNGSMKVRIQVNGTRFHCGRIICYFAKGLQKEPADHWHAKSFPAAWSVTNVFLDATVNNVGELTIPFYNQQGTLMNKTASAYTEALDYTGMFYIQVQTALRASTGTTANIAVNAWVEFELDQEFRVPVHSGSSSRAVEDASGGPMHYVPRGAVVYEHGDSRWDQSTMAYYAAQKQGNTITTNTTMQNYGAIDSLAMPNNVTGDAIGNGNDVKASLPMHKPGRMVNPIDVHRKAYTNFSSTIGSELVNHLDLDPSNQIISTGEHFGCNTDEMTMKFLHTRQTYGGTATWANTDASNTAILSKWIGPMAWFFQDGSQSQIALTQNSVITPPLFDYAASRFAFWRGSIRVRLDIVATQMHTGRLFFALNYGAPPDSESSLRDATSQYGVEIDINNEQHTFEFEIPYNAPTPWLRVCRGPRESTYEYAAAWFRDYFMGSWSLRVVNQLVAPDNVSGTIDIIWSYSGGDDFVVHYPTAHNACFIPTTWLANSPPSLSQSEEREEEDYVVAQKQSSSEAADDAVGVPTVTDTQLQSGVPVAPPGASISMPFNHFGHTAALSHLGHLIKRYVAQGPFDVAQALKYQEQGIIGQTGIDNNYEGWTITVPGGGGSEPTTPALCLMFRWVPIQPFFTGVLNTLDPPRQIKDALAPLPYWGCMYRYWRGCMRYKSIFQSLADYQGNKLEVFSSGAIYVPNTPVNSAGNANLALFAANVTNLIDFQYSPAISDGNYIHPLAGDVSLEQVPYNEIEVPFTTNMNVLSNQSALSTIQWQRQPLKTPGNILFYATFSYNGDDTSITNLKTGGISTNARVMVAAGDDFRFGTFLGPPLVSPNNSYYRSTALSATNPLDTWIITRPSESSMSESIVISEDEIQKTIAEMKQKKRVGFIRAEKQSSVQPTEPMMIPSYMFPRILTDKEHQKLAHIDGEFTYNAEEHFRRSFRFTKTAFRDKEFSCCCIDPVIQNIIETRHREIREMKFDYRYAAEVLTTALWYMKHPFHIETFQHMSDVWNVMVDKLSVNWSAVIEPHATHKGELWIDGKWGYPEHMQRSERTVEAFFVGDDTRIDHGIRQLKTRFLAQLLRDSQKVLMRGFNLDPGMMRLPCYPNGLDDSVPYFPIISAEMWGPKASEVTFFEKTRSAPYTANTIERKLHPDIAVVEVDEDVEQHLEACYIAEKQSGVEALPPTDSNILTIVNVVWAMYVARKSDPRSCLNSFQQQIQSTEFEIDYYDEGPDHAKMWACAITLHIENEKYDGLTALSAHKKFGTKKQATESASLDMLKNIKIKATIGTEESKDLAIQLSQIVPQIEEKPMRVVNHPTRVVAILHEEKTSTSESLPEPIPEKKSENEESKVKIPQLFHRLRYDLPLERIDKLRTAINTCPCFFTDYNYNGSIQQAFHDLELELEITADCNTIICEFSRLVFTIYDIDRCGAKLSYTVPIAGPITLQAYNFAYGSFLSRFFTSFSEDFATFWAPTHACPFHDRH